MEAIRVEQTITQDGQIVVTGLPYKKGQVVEVIVLARTREPRARPYLTVRQLRQSGMLGLWQDRDDIQDSTVFARTLREQAERRGDTV